MADSTAPDAKKLPLFTIIGGVFVAICFTTPMLFLATPLMGAAALLIVAMVRKERPRWIAPILFAVCALIFLTAGSRLSDIRGDSAANLKAAKIEDWSWEPDPEFGGDGTVRWKVVVRNTSDRSIDNVELGFTSYDKAGKLLASTTSYVSAIPAGQTRAEENYADYYGNEDKAEVVVKAVRFSGE